MLTFSEFFSLAGLAALVAYVLDAVRCKELAREAGKRACERAGVQFLDDTVQLTRLRLRRSPRGHIVFWREYRFEFTVGDFVRHPAQIALLGRQIARLCVEVPGVIDA